MHLCDLEAINLALDTSNDICRNKIFDVSVQIYNRVSVSAPLTIPAGGRPRRPPPPSPPPGSATELDSCGDQPLMECLLHGQRLSN